MASHVKTLVRPYLRRHKTLRKIACILVHHKPQKVYSWDDVGKLTDAWSAQLPPFDAIIGIPRSGLLVADRVAVNLGLPLSIPELFMYGILWQSHTIQKREIKRVLIVEDSVSKGELLFAQTKMLKNAFPQIDFYTGALMRTANCPIDYYYSDKWLATPNHLSVLDIP